MVELDTGLASQLAATQQKMVMSMLKNAADVQQQVADMVAQTVTASNRGTSVDLHA